RSAEPARAAGGRKQLRAGGGRDVREGLRGPPGQDRQRRARDHGRERDARPGHAPDAGSRRAAAVDRVRARRGLRGGEHRQRKRRPARAFCELDGWSFDPRYTEGRCPICGWVAPGAPEAPLWLTLARRFEWELAGLVVLVAVLAFIAVTVIHAAGYRVPWFGA